MKIKPISNEEFDVTKRRSKSGYRQEVLGELRKICKDAQNKGKSLSIGLDQSLSKSTLNFFEKTLKNEKILIQGLGSVASTEEVKTKNHFDVLTVKL